MQVLSHKKYFEKSVNNHTKTFIIPPERGIIFDDNNHKLAYNGKYWQLIIKNRKKDFNTVKQTLNILEVPPQSQQYILEQYKKNPFEDFIIYEFLTQDQVTNISINIPHLDNIYLVEGMARYYIHNTAYANLLGYVRTPTVADIQSGISKHPDIKIGAGGVEKSFNDALTGAHGQRVIEVDAFGHKMKDVSSSPPTNGQDLKLTINHQVQEFMSQLANGRRMSSVLMNIQTGGIIGMASSPSFDSGKLSQKITNDEWVSIINNPEKPMLNRAFQAIYQPGSIFKIIVALASLEQGVNPEKEFYCNGTHRVGRKVFHCWKNGGHGRVNFNGAVQQSCNVYFYNMAEYITVDDIKKTALKLGMHQIFESIPLAGQRSGYIPDTTLQKHWRKGDLINTIIGQGLTGCTTLQIATMMARIASGKIIMPYIQEHGNTFTELPVNSEHLDTLRHALIDASNTRGGTSYYGRIKEFGYEFAGKTGTAQVVSKFVMQGEAYKKDSEKPNGLFSGFAPYYNPKFSIATICENAGYGSTTALPFSSAVLYYAQKLYNGLHTEAEDFRIQTIGNQK